MSLSRWSGRQIANALFVVVLLAYALYAAAFIHKTSVVVTPPNSAPTRHYVLFDDAMISMRYAKNLANGDGLVTVVQAGAMQGLRRALAIALAVGEAFSDATGLAELKRANLEGRLPDNRRGEFTELQAAGHSGGMQQRYPWGHCRSESLSPARHPLNICRQAPPASVQVGAQIPPMITGHLPGPAQVSLAHLGPFLGGNDLAREADRFVELGGADPGIVHQRGAAQAIGQGGRQRGAGQHGHRHPAVDPRDQCRQPDRAARGACARLRGRAARAGRHHHRVHSHGDAAA